MWPCAGGLQDLVIATCAAGHVSGLFITHDLAEAARLAHRIAVLDTRGRRILGQRVLAGDPRRSHRMRRSLHGCRQRCGRIRCSGTSTMSTKGRSHEHADPPTVMPGPCR